MLRRLLGREAGPKAEQTAATFIVLIALRTLSLEVLLCVCVFVYTCVQEHLCHMGSSQGAPLQGESRAGQGQRW